MFQFKTTSIDFHQICCFFLFVMMIMLYQSLYIDPFLLLYFRYLSFQKVFFGFGYHEGSVNVFAKPFLLSADFASLPCVPREICGDLNQHNTVNDSDCLYHFRKKNLSLKHTLKWHCGFPIACYRMVVCETSETVASGLVLNLICLAGCLAGSKRPKFVRVVALFMTEGSICRYLFAVDFVFRNFKTFILLIKAFSRSLCTYISTKPRTKENHL